jgi:hypothetical protein
MRIKNWLIVVSNIVGKFHESVRWFLLQFLSDCEVEQSRQTVKMVLTRESSSASLRNLFEFDLDVSFSAKNTEQWNFKLQLRQKPETLWFDST